MTSFAFILGVVPLMISQGAGAEMRRTLGTAVFSGMLGVTLVGVFLTPVFFSVIDWLSRSALFVAWPMQLIGAVLLDVMTLGSRRLAAVLIGKPRRRLRPAAALSTNGKIQPPHA